MFNAKVLFPLDQKKLKGTKTNPTQLILVLMSNMSLITGGPLMVEDGKGSFTLVGIVSWGLLRCTTQDQPGVFARVTNFVGWIKSNTGGSNICES